MRVKRICKICNKEFWAITDNSKYCSDKCKHIAHKRQKAYWKRKKYQNILNEPQGTI